MKGQWWERSLWSLLWNSNKNLQIFMFLTTLTFIKRHDHRLICLCFEKRQSCKFLSLRMELCAKETITWPVWLQLRSLGRTWLEWATSMGKGTALRYCLLFYIPDSVPGSSFPHSLASRSFFFYLNRWLLLKRCQSKLEVTRKELFFSFQNYSSSQW